MATWFVVLGISSSSRLGSAQPLVRAGDEEQRQHVRVRGEAPGLRFELFRLVDRAPMVRCDGECIIALRPGKYGLRVFEGGAQVGERTVVVRGPATWTVSPHDPALRSLGLGLGIAGPVLLFAGALLTMPVLMSSMCHDSDGCTSASERQAANVGLFALIGGAVATPVGWTLFAKNLRPRLELAPLNAVGLSSVRVSSWRLGVAGAF